MKFIQYYEALIAMIVSVDYDMCVETMLKYLFKISQKS